MKKFFLSLSLILLSGCGILPKTVTQKTVEIINKEQVDADAKSIEAYAKTIETNYYTARLMGEDVSIMEIEITQSDYAGDPIKCENRMANADGTDLRLINCTVGDTTIKFNYANGKATIAE